MTRFVTRLMIVYTLVTIVLVSGIVFYEKHQQSERRHPRKSLYVVNLTADTLSVYITGNYTKAEKRTMTDKPDEDDISARSTATPYSWHDHIENRASSFRIPHKSGQDIGFPENFELHIDGTKHDVVIGRKQFYDLIGNDLQRNSWIIYITPELLTLFNNN